MIASTAAAGASSGGPGISGTGSWGGQRLRRQITSGGRGLRGGQPLPQGPSVGYPLHLICFTDRGEAWRGAKPQGGGDSDGGAENGADPRLLRALRLAVRLHCRRGGGPLRRASSRSLASPR